VATTARDIAIAAHVVAKAAHSAATAVISSEDIFLVNNLPPSVALKLG
jgi:hypothetical protein